MTTSKAWLMNRHGSPAEVLHCQPQELPDPGPGQALVKIHAIGVNRSDLNYVLGAHFPARAFPTGLGGEAVGEVIALGPPAEGKFPPVKRLELSVGSRVGTISGRIDRVSMGVYRDTGLYDQAAFTPIPSSYSYEEAAGLWTAVFTMAGAMEMAGFTAKTGKDRCVMITAGASGMGVMGLKLARHWGASTIATTRNPEKAQQLRSIADQVIVCHDNQTLTEGMKSLGDNLQVDLILDPVGGTWYPAMVESLAHGGNIVSYENISGRPATFPIMDIMMKDARINGFTTFRAFSNPALLDYLVEVGLNCADAIRPEIAQTFQLAETPRALETLGQSKHLGKLVISA